MIPSYNAPPAYGQPFSVSKRPLTEQEIADAAKPYTQLKKPLGFFSLFAVFISVIMMFGPVEANIDMFSLMALVFGLISIALAGTSFRVRRDVAKVIRSGEVTIVQGYARRSQSPAGWVIGPITVRDTQELAPFMREGPATVEYIPAMKAAMRVNGVRLLKGALVVGPADLAPTAAYQMPQAPMGPPQRVDEPPPPPPDFPQQQVLFCPWCSTRSLPGARFCESCGKELSRL
jgi:hypothetical protein